MSRSLSDLLPELRRPYTAAAIKVKPQVVTQDKTRGLVTYYIDSRLLVERLNAVVGADGWSDSYRLLVEGADAVKVGLPTECALSILGVTKADVGQLAPGEMDDKAWKSAYSDAFKRAGVKFGVGAFLYNLPEVWVETKVGSNGKVQGFSDAGKRAARDAYTKWLASAANIYGDPLDHGDVDHDANGSAGDPRRDTGSSESGPSADSQSAMPGDEPASPAESITAKAQKAQAARAGKKATKAEIAKIDALIPEAAKIRNLTEAKARAAIENDYGPIADLTQEKALELTGKLERWAAA